MKQAVTNISENGCMKSPVSTISCRSLQHKSFVHVAKIDWSFPCISMTKKIQEYCSSLSLSLPICVCVEGVCGWVHVWKEEREREREREKGGGGQRGYKEAEAAPLPPPPPSPSLSLSLSVISAAGLTTGQSSK